MEKGLNGTQLKWIALCTMVIDHVGYVFLPYGTAWYWLFRGIGRLAFPLYCFLLVEGFCHTGNVNRYLIRLGLFAVLSELPFDWMTGTGMNTQNVFFTLFLGVLMLHGFVRLQNRGRQEWAFAWCILCGGLAWCLRVDYGWEGLVLIFILYFFRADLWKRRILGFGTMVLLIGPGSIPSLAAFMLMDQYNGERGSNPYPALFYISYPLHMLVLAAICRLLPV